MKKSIKTILLQDLFIGAWVYEYMEIPKRLSTPMYVEATFESGDIYLTFRENEGDPFEAEIKNIRGIEITPDILRHFCFKETDHNVFEKECDGFKVVVFISDHQHYRLVKATIQHKTGGFKIDENLIFIHQLQKFVFDSTREPLVLDWK